MNTKAELLSLTLISMVASQTARAAEGKVDFTKDIQPILERSCIKCHGPEKQKGKLRLDSKDAAMKGGADGLAIVAGDATKGELYRRVTLPKGHDDIMPNEGDPLTKAQTDLIRDWINQGAVWTGTGVIATTTTGPKKNEPILPTDFKPNAAEQTALNKLNQSGADVRLMAMNVPWREANLRLLGSNVTDAVVAPLKDVRSLVDLNLASTRISDAGLASIKSLPYLQRLHLEQTAITDAGLAHLKGLTNLTYLNLYGTAVTDAGLEHLKGLRFLSRLYVWQTKVTEAGIANLKKTLPNLEIIGGWDASALPKKEDKPEEKKE